MSDLIINTAACGQEWLEPLGTTTHGTFYRAAVIVQQQPDGMYRFYATEQTWPDTPIAQLLTAQQEIANLRAQLAQHDQDVQRALPMPAPRLPDPQHAPPAYPAVCDHPGCAYKPQSARGYRIHCGRRHKGRAATAQLSSGVTPDADDPDPAVCPVAVPEPGLDTSAVDSTGKLTVFAIDVLVLVPPPPRIATDPDPQWRCLRCQTNVFCVSEEIPAMCTRPSCWRPRTTATAREALYRAMQQQRIEGITP